MRVLYTVQKIANWKSSTSIAVEHLENSSMFSFLVVEV